MSSSDLNGMYEHSCNTSMWLGYSALTETSHSFMRKHVEAASLSESGVFCRLPPCDEGVARP